jgi:small subunit ribosomal protein S4
MARYTAAKCKLCRREGQKLYLRGSRCDSVKCAIAKRAYPPGEHPWRRGKISDYGIQLRQKQKVKRYYGVQEKQFKNYFKNAERQKGNTGENLLQLLERRLDNVINLLGLATSRAQARQLIVHGHFCVNGHKVDIPSYLVRQNDRIHVMDKEKSKKIVKDCLDITREREVASWLSRDEEDLAGVVINMPTREEVSLPIEEQLIVELCSK